MDYVTEARKRIILPVDGFVSLDEIDGLMEEVYGQVGIFKIGLEVIHAIGTPQIMEHFDQKYPEAKIFLDVKFKDIPNTLERATLAARGVFQREEYPNLWSLNVYADSGEKNVQAVTKNSADVLVFVLTILSSMTEEEVFRIYHRPLGQIIVELAQYAIEAEAQGIICAARDLAYLSVPEVTDTLAGLMKITPGIRPEWAQLNDQKRVMTPKEAILAGADFLVIGRPITQPPSTVASVEKAVQLISEEIATGLEELDEL